MPTHPPDPRCPFCGESRRDLLELLAVRAHLFLEDWLCVVCSRTFARTIES